MAWRQTKLHCWLVCCMLISASSYPPVVAAEQPPSIAPTLNEKDLFPYKPKGRGTVSGQVFLSTPSGKAFTQAGVPVHLIPRVQYTRHWFDGNVRGYACTSKTDAPSPDHDGARLSVMDCIRGALSQLLTEQRLAPYLRTTRANPTGHFWFTKIPSGRYYLVSLLEGGSGTHQDERAGGIAWATVDLDVGEKASNLVVTDCKSGLC
ncbi:MAG: hypothetical protein AB7P24_06735 [Nitrospira sp.]|nr:hypothetical protein [Nitrospira sp. WS238]